MSSLLANNSSENKQKKDQNISMIGKRVIVTGPTSGFGKEIAIELAALGAELVLACRDLERGERTADEIKQRTGAKNCAVMHVDTSSQKSINEFSLQFRLKYSHLDVLVNNAGINRPKQSLSQVLFLKFRAPVTILP
jgi:NADP-dependent 3-hydroxy acid dehydrogenase YdfG